MRSLNWIKLERNIALEDVESLLDRVRNQINVPQFQDYPVTRCKINNKVITKSYLGCSPPIPLFSTKSVSNLKKTNLKVLGAFRQFLLKTDFKKGFD